jgi:hypothetical protein
MVGISNPDLPQGIVHHDCFKFFTVVNGAAYGIIDICDLEITLQVIGIGFEKTPQPSHVVPLVEQRIQDVILVPIISDRPKPSIFSYIVESHILHFSAKIQNLYITYNL